MNDYYFRMRTLKKKLSRFLNVATLVSVFSTLFTFAPLIPVRAEPLESLSVTLAQPIYSADWDTDPTYTNVSYTWSQTRAFEVQAGDPCMASDNCFSFNMALQDSMLPGDIYQEWQGTVVVGDITLSPMPANLSIANVTPADSIPSNGRSETLIVAFDCSGPCLFATSTEYTLTIVNSPIQNMEPPTPYVEGVYTTTTHRLNMFDLSVASQETEVLTAVSAVGQGLTTTATVDPSLTFSIQGYEPPATFYSDDVDIDNSLASDTCDFGTLTPVVPKICAWYLNIATNASGGYSIYVVQDQNMTFGTDEIKKYKNGTRTDESGATAWSSPSAVQLAHLGYSSDDTSVFDTSPSGNTIALWAGVPDMAEIGDAPVTLGLVADSGSPGDDQYTYALQVESASTLPQGDYTHNQYFIVVGNF